MNSYRSSASLGLGSFAAIFFLTQTVFAQVTTQGFRNLARPEVPGTLLSSPVANGSEPIGRTTSINYLNGWVIVGPEGPGSREGSDLVLRVYDISNPSNPVRRYPSDFLLTYPNNRWYQGNYGWNTHGTAKSGSLLLPEVLGVQTFGGPVELGGTNWVPDFGQLPLWYNRSCQAGPWHASNPWYGSADETFFIEQMYLDSNGYAARRLLAEFDHVGTFGGGDWHPMFFGDLLIYARSGGAGRDGVVVYRLKYNNFDHSDHSQRSITPQLVRSLNQGFEGYWPVLFSDGSGLYVVGSNTDILMAANITEAADPNGDGSITLDASLAVPNFRNATYPVFQDQNAFIHNRKIDMGRFLAGDSSPFTLTLDETTTGIDTSQMSLLLGNLWLTGGVAVSGLNQGMAVWVHQQAPDTTAPRVSYHVPQVNRTSYPRHAPLSFLVHEHSRSGGARNGIDFKLRKVNNDSSLGNSVSGFLIHDFSGVMTFTPNAGLDANTTYQVDFLSDPDNQIGFFDTAGNVIEPYTFRFSTGSTIASSPPPTITEVTSLDFHPSPGEVFEITAIATGIGALEYRFNFDGSWSEWGSDASASFTYQTEGRPQVLIQVRDSSGAVSTDTLRPLVINAPSGPQPTQSSTMAIGDSSGGRQLWVVNPDANTVSVLNAATGTKQAEYQVGEDPRNIARDINGRYWVTCHGSDSIWILNDDGTTFSIISLDYGDAPYGVCVSPDGLNMFVSLYGSGKIQRYLANSPGDQPVETSTFPTPRAIAVSGDGARVLLTRFISPDLEAEVAEFNGTSTGLGFVRTFKLKYAIQSDGGDRAAGMPNYLAGIAISPNGQQASVVSKQDNIQRGVQFGVPDLTHETTVRAVISFLDLSTNQEIPNLRKDFDNSESPSAVVYTPLGDTVLVSLQGNNLVVGMDTLSLAPTTGQYQPASTESSPAVVSLELETGLAPQGLLIDPETENLFIQNFTSRSVSVRDLSPLLIENKTLAPEITTTDTVASELLTAEVLLGKQIFYNAADPRMSGEGYISCATCHIDGGHDGQTWDFTGRGEGFRRTTDLRGRSGVGHGNVHWSGNFDEIQDFEHIMRGAFGGTGFLNLTPGEFAFEHTGPDTEKAGLNADLDALAAYVESLGNRSVPKSPNREPDGSPTAEATRGLAVFHSEGCKTCHSGKTFTSSSSQPLLDVGTLSSLSGTRLAQTLNGIDTPTLHGLHASRTFLHNGQADTLLDAFEYSGGELLFASDGIDQIISDPSEIYVINEDGDDAVGGGGYFRGALNGGSKELIEAQGAGIRYNQIDGGVGGPARISVRYAVRYMVGGMLNIKVNGENHLVNVYSQQPDDGWMTSGWRWASVDTTLDAGTDNAVEVLRQDVDIQVNAVLVSNNDVITKTQPHRRVLALSVQDRADLMDYLSQQDGRDSAGFPLPNPGDAPQAPIILVPPQDQLSTVGNSASFSVTVSGTGPITYEWFHDGSPTGGNFQNLQLNNLSFTDAGEYTVRVTNIEGSVTSPVANLSVNPALTIATTQLPKGRVNQSYSYALEATGGSSGRLWTISSGVLPSGLSFSSEGIISGVPTVPATVSITFQVSDNSGSDSTLQTLEVEDSGGTGGDSDLILHYAFDENGGSRVWDSSVNGNNHTTDFSGGTWVSAGRFGGAYGPADSSEVTPFFPVNQGDLNFDPQADAYTISVWVRTNEEDGYRAILGKGSGDPIWSAQYRLWIEDSASLIQPVIGNYYQPSLDVSDSPVNNGDWHMITLVNEYMEDFEAWRARLYYNDGTQYIEDGSGPDSPLNNLLQIGNSNFGADPWKGQIDDLRIYRRALTQSEIAELYSPPVDGTSFNQWLSENLTAEQLADSNLNGANSDADNDGIDNITEFGLSPDQKRSLEIRLVRDENAVELTTSLNIDANGVRILIEKSADQINWNTILVSQNGGSFIGSAIVTETVSGSNREIKITEPIDAERAFYRLRALVH